jgi:dTDP-4-dehydrorhamnose 3,5-epimerase
MIDPLDAGYSLDDPYFRDTLREIIVRFQISTVVETGVNDGKSTVIFCRMAPKVIGIDIDPEAIKRADARLKAAGLKNYQLGTGDSRVALQELRPKLPAETLYFLDAHWGGNWPILEEIDALPRGRGIIVVHDIMVPGRNFGSDNFQGLVLDHDYLRPTLLNWSPNYQLRYNDLAGGGYRGIAYVFPGPDARLEGLPNTFDPARPGVAHTGPNAVDSAGYSIPGVKQFWLPTALDHRGEYLETYNSRDWPLPEGVTFVQDCMSFSHKGVLRGLHGDWETWKLVTCLQGSMLLQLVDCRIDKPEPMSFLMTDMRRHQVLIPPGVANGHLCLDDCVFGYKKSTYFDPGREFTLKWDYINWHVTSPVLSERDKHGLEFADVRRLWKERQNVLER